MAVLIASDLSKDIAGSPLLRGVSFKLERRERLTVAGRNGAGKTTLLRTLAGDLNPARGSIRFDGEDATRTPVEQRVRRGIGHVPQEQAVFSGLTVKENLLIGQMADATGESKIDEVVSLFPRLGQRFQQKAGTLSGGERKMLAISRALLGRPHLLMLDEPAEGVWHGVIEEIAQRLERLARDIAVLIVEQHVELALRVAHYCYVMDRGRIALEGRPEEVRNDPNLVRLLAP